MEVKGFEPLSNECQVRLLCQLSDTPKFSVLNNNFSEKSSGGWGRLWWDFKFRNILTNIFKLTIIIVSSVKSDRLIAGIPFFSKKEGIFFKSSESLNTKNGGSCL